MALDSVKFTVSLVEKVTGPAKKAAGAIKNLGAKFVELAKKAAGAGLDKAKEKLVDLAKSAASAYVDLTKKVLGGAEAMVELALQAREQQDNQLALAQSITGSATAAQSLVDAQYRVAASSALAQDATLDLGNRLLKAGVGAGQYEATLKALADTAVIAGDDATKPIEKLIKKSEQLGSFALKSGTELKGSGIKAADVYAQLATDLGISVDKVKTQLKLGKITAEQGIAATNKVLESKFGAQAAGQLTDFSVQTQKFKDNIKNLFKDVDTSPFLQSLHKMLSLFDSTTSTGKALKKVLTSAMNGFFKAAANALPYVAEFLIGIGNAGLDVYEAIQPSIASLKKVFGLDGKQTTDGLHGMATAGTIAGYAISASFVGVVFTIDLVSRAVKAVKAAFNAIKGVGTKILAGIESGITGAKDYLKNAAHKFTSLAGDLIDGLVQGIENGAQAVIGAITGRRPRRHRPSQGAPRHQVSVEGLRHDGRAQRRGLRDRRREDEAEGRQERRQAHELHDARTPGVERQRAHARRALAVRCGRLGDELVVDDHQRARGRCADHRHRSRR
jgi:hypothetical protein